MKQLLSEDKVCDYVEIVFDSHEGLTSLDNMHDSEFINIGLVSEKEGYCNSFIDT
jgi:hypothetical protein